MPWSAEYPRGLLISWVCNQILVIDPLNDIRSDGSAARCKVSGREIRHSHRSEAAARDRLTSSLARASRISAQRAMLILTGSFCVISRQTTRGMSTDEGYGTHIVGDPIVSTTAVKILMDAIQGVYWTLTCHLGLFAAHGCSASLTLIKL